jgi:hypothetical protein
MVFGSYRRDDFSDPECFRVQLAGILERYPDKIIREATHYTSGIQRTCKFPPSIAEIVEFCDELKRRANYAKDWDAQSRKQIDERDSGQREPSEHRKKAAERVLQEYRKGICSTQSTAGKFANVLLRKDALLYQAMCDKAADPKTDPADWRWDENGKGIWVALGWLR